MPMESLPFNAKQPFQSCIAHFRMGFVRINRLRCRTPKDAATPHQILGLERFLAEWLRFLSLVPGISTTLEGPNSLLVSILLTSPTGEVLGQAHEECLVVTAYKYMLSTFCWFCYSLFFFSSFLYIFQKCFRIYIFVKYF